MSSLRPATAAYIACLLGLALIFTAVAATRDPGIDPTDLLVAVVATGCMLAAWLLPIQFAPNTKYYLDTAVMIASVLLLPPALAAVAIGTGTLAAHAIRPNARDWAEALFNTAQAMLVALAAAFILDLAGWDAGESTFTRPRPLLILPLVAVISYLLNLLLHSSVVASEARASRLAIFRSSLRQDYRVELLATVSLVATGTLAALVAMHAPWAILLLAIPIAATYLTLRRQSQLRQDAEQARLMSDASLAEAQRLSHVGSWEWLPAANRWVWSDEFYRVAGLEPRSFFPAHDDFMAIVAPVDRERVEDALRQARETWEPFALVHQIVLPDGTPRSVQQRGEPRRSETGAISFLGAMQDITERVRAEDAMLQATIAAQDTARVKTQLLTMASHDLRTPLTAIQGYLEIVIAGAAGEVSEDQRELLSVAHRNALQLTALVNDLLDLARIDAGRLPLQPRPTDVNAAISNALDTVAPLAVVKGIDLVRDTTESVILVTADTARLDQILLNLVGNAVKFTERGSVTVSTRTADSWAIVEIADTGIGIAEQALPHIFEEFNQGGVEARRKGGTGLGLAIVKHLVELHGGTIVATSILGEGTTFTMRLPAAPPPVEASSAAGEPERHAPAITAD